jgi:sulfite reductase alpha subunit-like flavoprotein
MKLAATSFTGTAIICLVATTCEVDAFAPCHIASANKASAVTTTATTTSALFGSKVGIWYSSSTGNTETVASYIAKAAGCEKDFNDIGDAKIDEIEGADCLIVGAPTWHTGADEQRSGTSWDEWFVYFMMHASCRVVQLLTTFLCLACCFLRFHV